jgi:serpin B
MRKDMLKGLFCGFVAVLFSFRCAVADIPPGPMSEQMRGVTSAQLDLGVSLVRAYSGEPNIVLSPYSLHAALTLARLGAKGDTAAELDKVLFPRGYSFSVLQGYAALNRNITTEKEGVQASLANSIWIEQQASFLDEYVRNTRSFFDSEPKKMDLSKPEETRAGINKWVADRTAQRITDLIPAGFVTPDLVSVLVNALYFKASWSDPFSEGATKNARFWISTSKNVDVPMMSVTHTAPYYEDERWQAVSLSYTGNTFEYLVLMPKIKLSAGDLARQLESSVVLKALESLHRERVQLSMPKHELRYKRDVTEDLRRLGLSKALSGAADFSGISTVPVQIGAVLHESFVKVDEKGTEAAAATAVMMAKSAMFMGEPKVMMVDRPFVFALMHRESRAPLFLGVIGEPRS